MHRSIQYAQCNITSCWNLNSPDLQVAWHGETDALNIVGTGENIVPTIHVQDLSNIVTSVADARPKTRYIVAVDDSMNSMTDIITVSSYRHVSTANWVGLSFTRCFEILEFTG